MKKVTQKQVTDFIFAQYDITLLPKYFYMQLENYISLTYLAVLSFRYNMTSSSERSPA